jgi:hypothetical protein
MLCLDCKTGVIVTVKLHLINIISVLIRFAAKLNCCYLALLASQPIAIGSCTLFSSVDYSPSTDNPNVQVCPDAAHKPNSGSVTTQQTMP